MSDLMGNLERLEDRFSLDVAQMVICHILICSFTGRFCVAAG